MQMIPGIKGGPQGLRMLWVPGEPVEVDDRIKVARGADPLIQSLAIGFVGGAGMIEA